MHRFGFPIPVTDDGCQTCKDCSQYEDYSDYLKSHSRMVSEENSGPGVSITTPS